MLILPKRIFPLLANYTWDIFVIPQQVRKVYRMFIHFFDVIIGELKTFVYAAIST